MKSLADLISPENTRPLVISHRGEWRLAPENSIEAMLLAEKAGADIVELDVQRTTSNALYMMHDDTTDRMTNRSGETTGVAAGDFRRMRLRQALGGPGAALTDIPVPTLRETLEAARGQVHLNLDTKHRRDLEYVGDMVREMGMADQVLIKMTSDPLSPDQSIKETRWFEALTFMPVMLDPRPGHMTQDAVTLCDFFDAKIIELSFHSLAELRETCQEMAGRRVRVWVNTLNAVHPMDFHDDRASQDPEGVWGTLISHGVGAIQTDRVPELIRSLAP